MSVIASLPAEAPFSPLQRAWLDGFLAGLLGDKARGAAAFEPPEPAEDFPWHDPTLSLDERLVLAAGKAPLQRLMAAMAQLDCGQCGYLCESYAAAIAGGAETRLNRCAPGGKATARALRELLGEAPTAAPPTAAPALAALAPITGNNGSVTAHLIAAHRLNQAGSDRDTRKVILAVETGIGYEVGDSLGVVARNCPELVGAIIARLGAAIDTPVTSPDGIERPLAEALAEFCEIRRPSDRAIEVLSSRAHDIEESRVLQAIAEGYPGAGPDEPDLLDLLDCFPSARPPLSELIEALDPLQPRLYSIASSPRYHDGEVQLTVAAVRYEKRSRRRSGVASTYLCDRLGPGDNVPVFVQPADGFRLAPADRPIVMIGPGTGIAPFRAFLQDREIAGARGKNWLFFGNPHRRTDFLFEDELVAWHRDGLLTRLDTAFSRDQDEKIYVQHRLLEHARELWAWLNDGAHLYVCGDAQRMARDVDRGLTYIIAKEGGMDQAAAKAYLTRLAAEGRYQRDVY